MQVMERISEFGPQNIADTLTAFSNCPVPFPSIWMAMRERIQSTMERGEMYNEEHLQRIADAFAKSGQIAPAVLDKALQNIAEGKHPHEGISTRRPSSNFDQKKRRSAPKPRERGTKPPRMGL